MSKKIIIKFECLACKNKTPTPVIKPGVFNGAVSWAECENCASRHLLRVVKAKGGGPTAYLYSVLEAEFSEDGVKQANHISAKAGTIVPIHDDNDDEMNLD